MASRTIDVLNKIAESLLSPFAPRKWRGLIAPFAERKATEGLAILLMILGGCAGYQIGNQSLFPAEIHTVYVPVVGSNSFRRNLGERITEAVIKEIEKRTPYKVVGDPNADSVLTCRLIGENKQVLVPDLTGDSRQSQVNLRMQVNWVDRKGAELRKPGSVACPAELVNVAGSGEVAPEVGQSIATAQQQAICNLAEQIVGLMEKPW